jgi:hypothetical protein
MVLEDLSSTTRSQADSSTSTLIAKLIDEAPADRVDLEWLLGQLQTRSFGLFLLILAIVIAIPGLGIVASILICFPAAEMLLNRDRPTLPHFLSHRSIATQQFVKWTKYSLPVLQAIERISRPRWRTPAKLTKQAIGLAVLVLAVCGLFPLPLVSILPSITIALIAIGYLQDDGLLLGVALIIALFSLSVFGFLIWAAAAALQSMMEWVKFLLAGY